MSAKLRKRSRSTGSNSPAAKAQQRAVPKLARPALSRRRKWLFRLIVMVLAPLLFFTVLEAGLRLGGYGYPTTFFVGPDADGTYTINPRFGWRFFPRAIAREPEPYSISAKSAGAVRIFVLGSSAAQGVPSPSFSFGRILEVLLRNQYPGVQFEVINAAMTAINSHVVLEIARDCAAHQPDLFVVYMGNNEVVGPYGPGTIFQQWSPSLKLVRANTWVKSMRIGQLFDDAIHRFHAKGGTPTTWQGMEMFLGNQIAADDPRLKAVYDNYRQNLIDLCGVARRAGVGVILSTVAVNLGDCPPFASQHRSDLLPEELKTWESIYQSGIDLEASSRWPEAIARYEAAARIDDRFAELQFHVGRCLAEAGRFPEARDCFILARDLDVLRFRADSRINAIVREVAAGQEAAGVCGVDAEQALANSDLAAGNIPGGDLFCEHVHLTFDGNYLLARAVLDRVDAALPRLAAFRKQDPVLSRQECAESLALTAWDEYGMAVKTVEMMDRPPFTNQLNHDVRQASARKRMERLGAVAHTPTAVRAACKRYEAALAKTPDDGQLHQRYGRLATMAGEPETAIEHLQVALKKMPSEPLAYVDLGEAEQSCGQIDEAIAHYRKALELDPDFTIVHYKLGIILADRGRADEAIMHYRKVLELDPGMAKAHNNLGAVLNGLGRTDEAIAEYQKSLEIDPKSVMAHNNLGSVLNNRGRADEAIAEFQKALETDERCVAVRFNLANAFDSLGRTDEAIEQHRRILKIDPNFALSHNSLGVVLARCRRLDEAIAHFQTALELKPDFTDARTNLKNVLTLRDRRPEEQ